MNKYLTLMRPKQWLKNSFVLAPLFFAFKVADAQAWYYGLMAVLAFTLVSAAVYVFNDVLDVEADRQHPRKKNRPVAAGEVSIKQARLLSAILVLLSVAVCVFLPTACMNIVLAYILLQLFYSFVFKHIMVLDVAVVAFGFVLRALMGGVAISVPVTDWMMWCVFMLALFMVLGKRYSEMMEVIGSTSRKVLFRYNIILLEWAFNAVAVLCFVMYVLYMHHMVVAYEAPLLYTTLVCVALGLWRYRNMVMTGNKGQDPEEIVLTDKWLLMIAAVWLGGTVIILMSSNSIVLDL